ncbi:apoptosis-resistant E3 ubiquitin protein ligase 1 isoform X3 [Nilaparvata lugens]|uniref:apoptosis-resistant E3 ubiquitin protein ligase 1 isoform X3 n=1 Tax=Nilaparvata lugens TaxID=108931 RepID=UPI00193E6F4E|nr:apoptosis-resistant E3 ubiquitin protein ligase 1 isoform X3 [Nilaparvata lugens]
MSSWSAFIAIALLSLTCTFSLMEIVIFVWSPSEDASEVDNWLEEHELGHHKELFVQKGISSLVSCATLEELPELPAHDEERLQRAARLLQQRLILRQWLHTLGLQHHHHRLLQEDVTSLEDVYWLEDSRARYLLGKDFAAWSTARQALPVNKEHLGQLKAELWSAVVKNSQHQDAWTLGGMLVVSVSVAGLVTLAAMTQPSLAPEAKHSLLQYVTGKYLQPTNCTVHFDWSDPHPVGQTMTFTVRFYQRNGQPYPICDTDSLSVEISEGLRRVATLVELGGREPTAYNRAICKFTVRHAGHYRIAVLVGNVNVHGSPFTKTFLPGPPDPLKTAFVRHSSTVVCTAEIPHCLAIEPRDEFNNLCHFVAGDDPINGYTCSISHLGGGEYSAEWGITSNFDYDEAGLRVRLTVAFPKEGCYRLKVAYNGVTLHNGDFDCIVLTSSDAAMVHKNVRNHNICYEARLLSYQGEKLAKARKVLVYVSPKQLTIKEFLLKFIPKRLVTFRLCPSTKVCLQDKWYYQNRKTSRSPWNLLKFHFLGENNQSSMPAFVIDDGCQPKVELMAKDRNVIAATFTHFLLKNIGGSETFKDKQEFFYHEVRRFHHKHYHEKLAMKVNRDKLLESSLKATKGFSVSDWCRNFEITFQGEQGVDWGGLRREWFQLVCAALFDPKNHLFKGFSDTQQALVHPNAKRPAHLKLKHYEFAGRLVGKCLYESALGGGYRQLVRARFTRSFLAQLIGLRVHYKYFEQDDPDLYLSKIKYILEHDVEDMDLYFVEEDYDQTGQLVKVIKVVELIPNGAKTKVGNNSKLQYLDALAQYRLATSLKDEVECFLKGLNDLIPDNLLSIFDENELELLLCGTGEYNVADFRAHHVVNGSSPEFRRILDWFWTAVANFTLEEMARLLQFTTGSSQLPPAGFRELSPRFQLTPAPTFGNLPTAHTCFNQLCLPDYESYEHFEKALLLAISEGTEGFGMI